MPVKRCTSCNEVCHPNDEGQEATECTKCGSSELVCDHPGGHFVRSKQCFICSWCGAEMHRGISRLREFAANNPEHDLQSVIDTTNH